MVILIMGVAGAGKTTVGESLATELGWTFVDGDTYHSPQQVAKMHAGFPLTDADRAPWLASLRNSIQDWLRGAQNVVLAASALKEKYRDELLVSPDVKLVYLRGTPELIRSRLLARRNHYMNPALLDSQFADLEGPDNADAVVDVSSAPAQLVSEIRHKLQL